MNREWVAGKESMHPLKLMMNPSSLVFWGASNNSMKMGTIQLTNVLETGYRSEEHTSELQSP